MAGPALLVALRAVSVAVVAVLVFDPVDLDEVLVFDPVDFDPVDFDEDDAVGLDLDPVDFDEADVVGADLVAADVRAVVDFDEVADFDPVVDFAVVDFAVVDFAVVDFAVVDFAAADLAGRAAGFGSALFALRLRAVDVVVAVRAVSSAALDAARLGIRSPISTFSGIRKTLVKSPAARRGCGDGVDGDPTGSRSSIVAQSGSTARHVRPQRTHQDGSTPPTTERALSERRSGSVAVAPFGEEPLELRGDGVRGRELAALVDERRRQRIVLHVAVVALLESPDEPL